MTAIGPQQAFVVSNPMSAFEPVRMCQSQRSANGAYVDADYAKRANPNIGDA